jgi:type VI secretion system protein ImpA
MMKRVIDIDAILAPIPGDNPAGEDLRYSPVYDEIKEARRADDPLDRGDWQREVKASDWDKVITVAVEALTNKTKDLQIAVWLTEALIKTDGFVGLATGLKILIGLLRDYWEHVYPDIEEGDLDFRVGPLEFMNDKLWLCIKEVPLTDPGATPGYSYLKWQESRQVGFEADTRNQYGDVDENKKQARDELIAEGKLTAEDFDAAVARSSRAYYESLAENLTTCLEEFKKFDETVDEKFGSEGPRLAEIRETLDDCERVVMKMLKEKKEHEPAPEPEARIEEAVAPPEEQKEGEEAELPVSPQPEATPPTAVPQFPASQFSDAGSMEKAMWENALQIMKNSGIKKALGQLFGASCSVPSVRERNRYQLLMAKLCLKADRPDLARPIAEKLNVLIEELQLERWESPVWIAEVLETLYQCLTAGEPSDDDMGRARELLRKLCTTDVTKAMTYRH